MPRLAQPHVSEHLQVLRQVGLVSDSVHQEHQDGPWVETLALQDEGGVTALTNHGLHLTKEIREGHVNAGLAEVMQRSLDMLEELVPELLGGSRRVPRL